MRFSYCYRYRRGFFRVLADVCLWTISTDKCLHSNIPPVLGGFKRDCFFLNLDNVC